MTMATIIETFTSIATAVTTVTADIATTVVATPIMLLPLGIGFVFTGVSLFKRLVKRR